MKFCIERLALEEALNICIKTTTSTTTLPILGCIHLVIDNQTLIVESTNLEEGTTIKIPIENAGELHEEAVIEAKILTEMIQKLNDHTIEIITEKNMLIIQCPKSRYQFNLTDEEYPKVKLCDTARGVKISSLFFKNIISRAGYCFSSNESSVPIMGGINLSFGTNSLKAVSLDGYRMAIGRESFETEGDDVNITIPAKSLINMIKTLKGDEEIELIIEQHAFYIVSSNIIRQCRLLEGDFIDVEKIIAITTDNKIAISGANRKELLSCTDRALVLATAGKNNVLNFSVDKDNMIIESTSDIGNTLEVMPIINQVQSTDLFKFALNGRYLKDALAHFSSDEVNITASSAVAPIIITSNANDDQVIILPIRIAS